MRFRTFAAVTLTVFSLPAAHALATDPPEPVAQPQGLTLPAWTAPAAGVPQLVFVPPVAAPVAPTPVLLPLPAPRAVPPTCAVPVLCAEGSVPRSALDYMRKLAALHAETGARATYMVKVRNVAAADVACAIQKHFAEKACGCTVGADPVTNTLVATGEPAQVRRALDLASALDVAPPQVAVSGLVLTVSREFLETAGLSTAKSETAWSLSARETHMLTSLIRVEKENHKLDTLARPHIQVADKQTGFVRVGQEVVLASAIETKVEGTTTIAVEKPVSRFVGMNLKVTPKLLPCGEAMTLTVDSHCSKPGDVVDLGNGTKSRTFFDCSVKATASLKKGESFVLLAHGDKDTVTLVVLTPSAAVQSACPGWFTK